jgi:hypothetical protein
MNIQIGKVSLNISFALLKSGMSIDITASGEVTEGKELYAYISIAPNNEKTLAAKIEIRSKQDA